VYTLLRKREKENRADLAAVRVQDNGKYDFLAVLAKSLILFCLVYGAVGGFLASFEIDFHAGVCMLALFALSFVLSAVYETGRRWLIDLTAFLVLFLYMAVAVTNYWIINSGYYFILNRIFDVAREYFDAASGMEYSLAVEDGYLAVTTFAVFLGMVGVILLNIGLHHKSTPFGILFLTMTPFVIPMYFERTPPLFYCILMLTGYAAVMPLSYGRGRVSKQMRCLLPVAAVVVVLLVRAAAFLVPEQRYERLVPQSQAKAASGEGMELFARYGMQALFPQDTAQSGVSGGKLSKGSAVMPSNETALVVKYTPYSFAPVYLKAFTGVDYIGTAWTEAAEEWPEDSHMEMSLYSRQRQFESEEAGEAGGIFSQGRGIMEVEKRGADAAFEYRPYYTDYCNIEEKGGVFTYCYYPDNGASASAVSGEPYGRYLNVPSACEAAVRQVCEEAGFGGTDEEIAQQIKAYFVKDYKYTLRPGLYYGNPDYISHFLLESKKGYCAHFASAATMLFRQMGIPARYAEGYAVSYTAVVEKGELVEGADYGDYYRGFSEIGETALIRIEVPQAYAHAWVEIFDSERGWIVIDPTPPSVEEERTSFWEAFMQGEGRASERTLGEDVLGGYLENAVGAVGYVLAAVFLAAVIGFLAVRMIRKEKERRLPDRERVKLEYRRLQKAAGKDKAFLAQRTLREEIGWMRENCRADISKEQEEALYQVFFAKEIDYDCDRLCRELQNCRSRSIKKTARGHKVRRKL